MKIFKNWALTVNPVVMQISLLVKSSSSKTEWQLFWTERVLQATPPSSDSLHPYVLS